MTMDNAEEMALAKRLFNACWDLIEKENRTAADDLEMIHLAHTSRWHWGNVGGLKEIAIGEWQCARVHALVGHGNTAFMHATRAKELSADLPQPNFMSASASEALAFAAYIQGNLDEAKRYKAEALELLTEVDEKDAAPILAQIHELPF
jgi:hypothetical protein